MSGAASAGRIARARRRRGRRRRSRSARFFGRSAAFQPAAPCRGMPFVRLRWPPWPSRFTAASTASAAMRRYVVSLPPVTVTTPLSDVRTEWRLERSAVRSLLAAAYERPQTGPGAQDVGFGDLRGRNPVDRTQEVRDVFGRDLGVVDGPVVVGVGRADVGELVVAALAAPRYDEHRAPVFRYRDHDRDPVAARATMAR